MNTIDPSLPGTYPAFLKLIQADSNSRWVPEGQGAGADQGFGETEDL